MNKLFFVIFTFIIFSFFALLISINVNNSLVTFKGRAVETSCKTPGGCGGNCNPNLNSGCGYGGCRFWEYCADENSDGVYSCYWKTAGYAKPEDYPGACHEKASASNPSPTPLPTATKAPTPIPNTTVTLTPSLIASNTPTPTVDSNAPSPTLTSTPDPSPTSTQPTQPPISSGNYDMSKLCIPLEVNGDPGDKLDIVVIPMGYTKESAQAGFYDLAKSGIRTLQSTNLREFPNETYKKLNWYILNVYHPDFHSSFPPDQPIIGFDKAKQFGSEANYCNRDIYMMILNEPENNGGIASFGVGAIIYSGGLIADGGKAFAHEWGHAAVNLRDEVPSTDSSRGVNCTSTPASNTSQIDPCPPVPFDFSDIPPLTPTPDYRKIAGSYYCDQGAINNDAYKQPCPAWDCNQITCTDLQKRLLASSGCYPRCGTVNDFRPAPNSIMSNPWDAYLGMDFNGPSLSTLIESSLGKYK